MVEREGKHLLLVGLADQAGVQQGRLRQIERAPRDALDGLLARGVARRALQVRDVDAVQVHARVRIDHETRLALRRDEARAQALVAGHQHRQHALEQGFVQRPAEAQGRRDVVGVAAGVHLAQEPQPLLRVRDRHVGLARHPLQRGQRGTGRRGAVCRQVGLDLVLAPPEFLAEFRRHRAFGRVDAEPVPVQFQVDVQPLKPLDQLNGIAHNVSSSRLSASAASAASSSP